MASFVTPYKRGPTRPPQRPNIIRAFREREDRLQAAAAASAAEAAAVAERTPVAGSSELTAAAAAAAPPSTLGRVRPGTGTGPARVGATRLVVPTRQKCPNTACTRPNVIEGTCRTCGRVVDDCNIVAEVQFGETSSGAAVVQGSYLAAHQGGVRAVGPAFRRVGGSDEREKSIREARSLMLGYAQQLNLGESTVSAGVQAFKLASAANFVQGRTLPTVAAVCLYAACRNEPPCKVMLIDLADLVQVNVFKLGRTFKKLNDTVPLCNDGMLPVYPEDLIWRFASKLEFRHMTARVAEDAVRLVKRMSRDWIVMGRRPSGICGACLLMAARMHNFRRTVREVVYIVKVTSHTIQMRLEEFNQTESSRMTVEDFLKQDFLESSHDPPSFYRNTDEWLDQKQAKKRKRKSTDNHGQDNDRDDADDDQLQTGDSTQDPTQNGPRKRRINMQKTNGVSRPQPQPGTAAFRTVGQNEDVVVDPNLEVAAPESPLDLLDLLDLSSMPLIEYRRDAEGFIIPPLPPSRNTATTTDPHLLDAEGPDALDALVRQHGGGAAAGGGAAKGTLAPRPKRGAGAAAEARLPVTHEWEEDEVELEGQIQEMFNDPNSLVHAMAYSNAEQRAAIHATWARAAEQAHRPVPVSMEAEVGEDEFAHDPEVLHCLLTPAEALVKETLWVNENREWLRAQQERVFRRKLQQQQQQQQLEEHQHTHPDGPPAARRHRRHRPRIGEGQTSPASTPGEAAVAALRERAWSKRINYDAIRDLFDLPGRPGLGSAITSRRTSRAGSVDTTAPAAAAARHPPPEQEDEADDDDGDDDDAPLPDADTVHGEFADQPLDYDDMPDDEDENMVGWDEDDD